MSNERPSAPSPFRPCSPASRRPARRRGCESLCLLEAAELTVSELVAILGQSQPRVSRHLKLMVEAGLASGSAKALGRSSVSPSRAARWRAIWLHRLDPADPSLNADRARLDVVREARRRQAAAYFAERAADWDSIRALHAPEERVEAALIAMIGDEALPQPARSRNRNGPDARASRPPRGARGRRRPERGDAGARPQPHRSGRAFATSNCARATSTPRRSSATLSISSSSTRCCTSSTIRRGR